MNCGYFQGSGRRASILVVIASSLSACVSSIQTPYVSQDRDPVVADAAGSSRLSAAFDYPQTEITVDNHDLPSKDPDYQLKHIRFPALHDNGQPGQTVSFRYYRRVGPEPRPLVIVLPIYGSYTYPSEKITQGLLGRDPHVNVALLEYDQHLFPLEEIAAAQSEEEVRRLFDRMRDRLVAGVVDVRRVIDWAGQQEDIDTDGIAVVSFSMSAIIGAALAQHEPRLSAGVIVMGSAGYHDVLTVCAGRAGMAREAVMQRFGWSEQEYRQELERTLGPMDPGRYPGLADPSRLLMIDSHYDDCMPQHTRDALWDALGRPERISYRYTHKRSFLAMTPLGLNVMRRQIYDFVGTKLDSG